MVAIWAVTYRGTWQGSEMIQVTEVSAFNEQDAIDRALKSCAFTPMEVVLSITAKVG